MSCYTLPYTPLFPKAHGQATYMQLCMQLYMTSDLYWKCLYKPATTQRVEVLSLDKQPRIVNMIMQCETGMYWGAYKPIIEVKGSELVV